MAKGKPSTGNWGLARGGQASRGRCGRRGRFRCACHSRGRGPGRGTRASGFRRGAVRRSRGCGGRRTWRLPGRARRCGRETLWRSRIDSGDQRRVILDPRATRSWGVPLPASREAMAWTMPATCHSLVSRWDEWRSTTMPEPAWRAVGIHPNWPNPAMV